MQPSAVLGGGVGDLLERVERAGVDLAGLCADDRRPVAALERCAQRAGVHASLRVGGNRLRRPKAEQPQRAVDGHVAFLADEVVSLPGVELLNDVVLNQVLFRFASDEETVEVLRRVQDSGDVWMSGTTWDGIRAIRVSVSNWQTTDEEIELALRSFREAAQPAQAPAR